MDLALNNLQWLIRYKPNITKPGHQNQWRIKRKKKERKIERKKENAKMKKINWD